MGRGPGTKIDDILGYQRYLNVVGQIAQNNTDDNEPPRPNAKNFSHTDEDAHLRKELESETDDDGKRKTNFNISGMSFAEYILSI